MHERHIQTNARGVHIKDVKRITELDISTQTQ